MAPPQRYPSPAKQMVELGRLARREGLTFEAFWERSVRPDKPALTPRRIGKNGYKDLVGAVVWPSDTADRDDAQAAMGECKEVWRRAYEQRPATPADRAFVALHSILTESDVGGMETGADVPLAASI